jgi:hypothetical protein
LTLEEHVADHIALGSHQIILHIACMPEGYALMRNEDDYFYWLRADGVEGVICWDKWAVYRGAKENKALRERSLREHKK